MGQIKITNQSKVFRYIVNKQCIVLFLLRTLLALTHRLFVHSGFTSRLKLRGSRLLLGRYVLK